MIRTYKAALEKRIYPELGSTRLSEIQRRDVQRIADDMLADRLSPSLIRNTLMPLRVIFRRALEDGDVAVNPTEKLRLPAVEGRRDRIASPVEAAQLLAASPIADQAVWATAMYAGLRRGELLALRWQDVDLAAGVIHVRRSWDMREGPIEPKSAAGARKVPIASVLRDYLIEHKLRSGRSDGLVFGRSASVPFEPVSLAQRAATAWRRTQKKLQEEDENATVKPITLHECRHTFASLMIAAGVNAKALSEYMGHASVTITYDRYGHLMPGNEDEAAALLDAYLERAKTAPRIAQVG